VARRRRNAESAGEKQNAMEVGFGAVVCLLVGVRCSWQGLSCLCARERTPEIYKLVFFIERA